MAPDHQTDPARTRVLAERWASWILPHWLERQADPSSPAFAPAPPTGGVVNTTAVDRAPIGVLDGSVLATVDPRGLVSPTWATWSLDWWVGADDRWHVPSREPAVRQRLIDGAPVVETVMRVPGGDLLQRVWAAQDASAGEVIAVEFENASRLPIALALSIRPYGVDGAGGIEELAVFEDRVSVDGQVAMWLPKPPARAAASDLASGDVAAVVLAGEASGSAPVASRCAAGFATAAVVYPLAHTARLQLHLPGSSRPTASRPSAVPPADAVARGWASHLATGARIELPDTELSEALAAARAQLLLAASGRQLAGDTSTVDTAAIVGALDRLGAPHPAATIVATLPSGQGSGGRLGGADPDSAATSAALVAAGRHWRVTRDDRLVAEIAGPLAAGGHHHLRGRGLLRRGRVEPDTLVDLGWRRRGLLDASAALVPSQPDAADALARLAGEVGDELERAVRAMQAVDGTTLDAMALVAPLEVLASDDPFVDSLLSWVADHATHDGAVARLAGATGLSPVLTSLAGRTEARRLDPAVLDRLDWFVRAGGPARTWAELVHPRLGSGCGGDGCAPAAAAAFVELLLDVLVHESVGSGLVLCPVWPDRWLGAGVEVHGLRTTIGVVSFAVRWHGERPALLWEVEPHDDLGPVRLTAPGLDPGWSSTDLRGDALLAAPSRDPRVPEHEDPAPGGIRGPGQGDSFA
jgi:hypothetical protein